MSSNGNRTNAGRPDGLNYKIQQARKTAPPEYEGKLSVLSVAWAAYEGGRDPADVWAEVVADG